MGIKTPCPPLKHPENLDLDFLKKKPKI